MPNQIKKLVYSSADDLYLVIQRDNPPYKAEKEDQEVRKILETAEGELKKVFDKSGPSLVTGVKIGITHLF
jgi:hypothetical protein